MSEATSSSDEREERLKAQKKELTVRLFHVFLASVRQADQFVWSRFESGIELEALKEALRLNGGNGRKAAALLGMNYNTFMNRVYKHNLETRRGAARAAGVPGSKPAESEPPPDEPKTT
jgi:transcriptional regulator with AAA-type ATPase domain